MREICTEFGRLVETQRDLGRLEEKLWEIGADFVRLIESLETQADLERLGDTWADLERPEKIWATWKDLEKLQETSADIGRPVGTQEDTWEDLKRLEEALGDFGKLKKTWEDLNFHLGLCQSV